MAVATVEEVELVVSKLLCDKSKLREEGVKQLLSYLDVTGGVRLAPLLDQQTSSNSQPDKLLSSTWPGVVRALCQCNKVECISSKKKSPKPIFSKALRNVIQKAEDRIHAGMRLFSQQDLRIVFSHLLEGMLECPSFVPDYSHVIRQLVTISDYCSQMSRNTYTKLVGYFMERVRGVVIENSIEAVSSKEDAFRGASTLHCLLQSPPEDFLTKTRELLVEGFNDVFLHLRDEGRIARKLLASLNLFLLKDGVNLGDVLIDIHSSIKGFILRTWKVTRDRDLKDELVLYGRLQLKLRTVILFSEGDFIFLMQPLVEKDLDQSCAVNFATGPSRFDGGREGKFWTLSKGVWQFLDFTASIMMEAHKLSGSRILAVPKKLKNDDVFSTVTERLLKGNSMWWGSFCLLVRYHHQTISRSLILEWSQLLIGSLDRAFTDASSTTTSFEALIWILRCLQELAAVSPLVSDAKSDENLSCHAEKQGRGHWVLVWMNVLHWLPMFSSTSIIVEECFKLLGFLLIKNLLPDYAVSKDFWGSKPFLEPPSGNMLFFLASYFTRAAEQVTALQDFDLWKKLIHDLVTSSDKQEYLQLKIMTISALTVGCLSHSQASGRQSSMSHAICELQDWAKVEDEITEDVDFHASNQLVPCMAHSKYQEALQDSEDGGLKGVSLPIKSNFVKELADMLISRASSLIEGKKQISLEQIFSFCVVITSCYATISGHIQRRGNGLHEWCPDGQVYQCLLRILNDCVHRVENIIQELFTSSGKIESLLLQQSVSLAFTTETMKSLKDFLSLNCLTLLLEDERCKHEFTVSMLIENLLHQIVRLMHMCYELLGSFVDSVDKTVESTALFHAVKISQETVEINILDTEFDDVQQSVGSDVVGSKMASDHGPCSTFEQQLILRYLDIISAFAQQLPDVTCDVLFELLRTEKDLMIKRKILLYLCKCTRQTRSDKVPYLVEMIETLQESTLLMEGATYFVLEAADTLLSTLLSPKKHYTEYSSADINATRSTWNLPQQVVLKLAKLLNDANPRIFLYWQSRGKLVETISKLIVLDAAAADDLLDQFLSFLCDLDYRVRCIMAKNVKVLFQAYTGHEGLFKDICNTFKVKLIMPAHEKIFDASDVSSVAKDRCFSETAVITLGEVAACSEKVEVEAVFMICANAAIFAFLRLLSCMVLDTLARKLNYPHRWKYLSHLLCCVFSHWIKIGLPLPTMVEIRDLLVCNSEPIDFLKYCSSWIVPPLLLYNRDSELTWLAKVLSKPVATLVKDSSSAVLASLLPLCYHGSEKDKILARAVLQGKMLTIANLSEDDRDILIRKNMVSIVNDLFQLCSAADNPQFPLYTKGAIISSVRTVVDGFCGSGSYTPQMQKDYTGVQDVLNIFRADRVFMFALQIHLQLESSYSSRHQRNKLAGLECLIDILQENVKVPNTCRYIFHIVLQSLETSELHKDCCRILASIIRILSALPREEFSDTLGPQLQLLISHLVPTCMKLRTRQEEYIENSPVFALLKQLTLDVDPSLHPYLKELPPFPKDPIFESLQASLLNFQRDSTNVYDFNKTMEFSSSLRPKSLQKLYEVLSSWHDCCLHKNMSNEVVSDSHTAFALLRSVRRYSNSNLNEIADVVGDIIARMGIGDSHAVVFSVPGIDGDAGLASSSCGSHKDSSSMEMNFGISDDVLKAILLELKTCLFDERAFVIELTVQTLKGILSTEKGFRVLKSLQPKDYKYLSVFSKGPHQRTVETLLNNVKAESAKKSIPLEKDLLWDNNGKLYEDWVCSLVYSLTHYCEDTILRLCQGVVHCKGFLAESLLPHILRSLAASSGVNSNICKLLSSQVERHIFNEKNQNTRSIQLFLNVLNELRRCDVVSRMKLGREYAEKHKKSKVYWLELDYLQTATVAQKCGAYFTSALYVEHWCEENFGRLSLGEPDFADEEEGPSHINLLLTALTQINEPDGAYGVIRSHKLNSQTQLFEHEHDWSKAIGSYDLLLRKIEAIKFEKDALSDNRPMQRRPSNLFINQSLEWNYNKGLLKALQHTGCNHLLEMYCKGLAMEKGLEKHVEFQELQFELAWRAGKWNCYSLSPASDSDFSSGMEISKNVRFNANLYWCLRSLHEGDADLFSSHLACAKQELVRLLSLTSLESTGNIFPSIIKLQMLGSLCKAWDVRWQVKTKDNVRRPQGPLIPGIEQLALIDNDRRRQLRHMQYQFDLFEPFVAYYTILLRVLQCESLVPQQLLDFATFARKAGRVNQASAAIYELKQWYKQMNYSKADQNMLDMSVERKVQEAKILWAQGQQEMAVNLVKYVINHHENEESLGSVLCLTGKWLADTRLDSARVILTQYLQKGVQVLENAENKNMSGNIEKRSRAFYRMGHYSDSLYKSYEERLNSNEWQAALRLQTHRSKEAEVLTRRIKAEKWESSKKGSQGSAVAQLQDARVDLARKLIELQKQLAMDNEEAQRLESDKETFLRIALNSYRQCLITSSKYDLRVVFRITSLWFNLSANQAVVKSMLDTINQVKSYKFLPLVYQIASRLGPLKESQGVANFQYALMCLVQKLATEHPYHTVYQLLALSNGDRVKNKQKNRAAFVVDMDKKMAAEAVLSSVASEKKALIDQMTQMVEVYIRLAELEVKKDDTNKKLPLPRDIRSIRQLELVPVVTAEIPVSPDANYHEGQFSHYKGLSDRFLVMHGVNTPKVVQCFGSDGRQHRQLVKSGDDDLRQDAVMEQLFTLVNLLLKHHIDTRQRRLCIRTYKVVPFTPSAGVLEWVDGTMPLGEYLLGSDRKGGAHARYGPDDWTFPTCREHIEKEEDKLCAFQNICKNFRPVFHNFFLEKFAHPAVWFERRLAYTRSVAASSMVGYIVGLGDRHAMNILLDQESAEVVHIDLGVAFEQGKMLKMPERVPFRLTRDIVDGMGVTGVEGVFRRCCEKALLVMRANKDALLTIIEVFIHDPLYKWALSPLKALQRQEDSIDLDELKDDMADLESSGENKDATRALMRVKQKLDGYEGGDMRSVEGQVHQLIQDAQDSDKLCLMYPGWGAWL